MVGLAGTGAVRESISSYSSTLISGLMVVVLSFGVVGLDVVVVVEITPLDSVSFLSEGLYPGRANINNSKIHFSQNIPTLLKDIMIKDKLQSKAKQRELSR